MTSRGDTYALQVVLKRVLGVVRLLDARVERVVDAVELAPHGVGEGAQRGVDLAAQLLADLALALRSRDVLLCELHPRVRNADAEIIDAIIEQFIVFSLYVINFHTELHGKIC